MVPPQVSPTPMASSSETLKTSTRLVPSARTSWAISYSALSIHPPETLPTTSPERETAIEAPGMRGEDRQVRTTVASAKSSPRACHCAS